MTQQVAIYARSSPVEDAERSLDEQVRLYRERAACEAGPSRGCSRTSRRLVNSTIARDWPLWPVA